MIIGCDLHTRYQQIAMLDAETGEEMERRLEHESGEAPGFCSALTGPVRVGIEATGYTHWFADLLTELGHELWMGACGEDSGVGGARAEDGCAGWRALVGSVARGSLSADLAAVASGAGFASTRKIPINEPSGTRCCEFEQRLADSFSNQVRQLPLCGNRA